MTRVLIATLTALVLIAGACGGGSTTIATGGDPGPDAEPTVPPTPPPVTPAPEPAPVGPDTDALEAARDLWDDAGITEYAYTVTMVCECTDEAVGPRRVTVRDGELVATTYFGLPTDLTGHTAEDLFALIAASIAAGAENQVSYDAAKGFPTVVRLDVPSLAADGGLDLQTADFVDVGAVRAELEIARATWQAAAVASYAITYREICFCPEVVIDVEVEDGQVGDVVVTGDGFDTPPRTVDDMFDSIANALDTGAFRVSATYNQELGYPTEFFVDVEQMMADEEFGVVVDALMVR
jgi:hypothetical protein